MIKKVYNEDIACSDADAIVNASNGQGNMGGQSCVKKRHRGVAESIQYISKGQVEPLAREKAKTGHMFGVASGTVFVTDAPGLSASYVVHAVTMRYPGTPARMKTIKKLLPEVKKACHSLNVKSVAIPLLGTGTGMLSKKKVLSLYEKAFEADEIEWRIYLFDKKHQ